MNESAPQIAPVLDLQPTPAELMIELSEPNSIQASEQGNSLHEDSVTQTLGKSALSELPGISASPDAHTNYTTLAYMSKGPNLALEKYQNDFAKSITQNAYAIKAENPFLSDEKFQFPASEIQNDWLDDEPWEDPAHEAPFAPGEFIKEAPNFLSQADDATRLNPITYVNKIQDALGTNTEGRESATLTEHESLVGLRDFLQDISNTDDNNFSKMADSMLENITFIGKREYDEAAEGIADQWRQRLRANPDLQLCVITGKIDPFKVKSDAYLFDNILKNLSEDEITEFGSRIITDVLELTAEPEDAAVVVLDDWTISGQQLVGTASTMAQANPKYKSKIEIQLVAATEQRIREGLPARAYDNQFAEMRTLFMPVKAYYKANNAHENTARSSGAHITGAHCAVDYDFNNEIGHMSAKFNRDMPPATNIVRPYRSGIKLAQAERLQRVRIPVEQTRTPMQIMLDEPIPQFMKGPHDAIY
jgi:hypothetical protein